ncbi:MAG: hypothetical protein AB8B93_14075 [Pseudomonadales bacterium]
MPRLALFGTHSVRPADSSAVGRSTFWCALALTLSLGSSTAWSDSRDQAKRIHDRIAGVPADAATLNSMAAAIDSGDAFDAALMATEQPEFYSVTLRNFAAPWTNRDQSVFVPLDDYIATVIGMVRDDRDFRGILSEDVLYTGSGAGVPGYSTTNNAHYEALENADLQAVLQSTTQSSLTGVPADATAGVMTTRSAAKAFFIDGTNRAMFRFTMLNHLCRDMEQVHDTSRAPDRIRQDVSRSPGGDARVFLNNCVGCHSGMDPLAQAFAYYDYQYNVDIDPNAENGSINYNGPGQLDVDTGTRVESKYFNNANNFEHGFQTPDDAWTNYWRSGQNAVLGWDTALTGSGSGAKSMGRELAHSTAFAQCQVEKVFTNVCLRSPADSADRTEVSNMVSSFRSNGHNLRRVFAESAAYCMGD